LAKGEKIFYRKTKFSGAWKIVQKIEEIFFNSYKGGCCFLEVKSSNKIETHQYFKKRFLWISRPNQNHMKQSDLGKSLDPNAHPCCAYHLHSQDPA
jgi:hypothetical protein